MIFDIYGNNLRSGHCEVHPHVHEEYPCSVCLESSINKRDESRQFQEWSQHEWQKLYEAHCLEVGFDPIALGM